MRLLPGLIALISVSLSGAAQNLINSDYHLPYQGIWFADRLVGWAWGRMGVIRTEDGGHTWISLTNKLPDHVRPADSESALKKPGQTVSDIAILNNREVWLVSDETKVLRTRDAGSTWEDVTPGPLPSLSQKAQTRPLGTIARIQFVDSDHGWLLTYRTAKIDEIEFDGPIPDSFLTPTIWTLLRTEDGGQSWLVACTWNKFGEDVVTKFAFFNKDWGLASQTSGELLRSSDGGMTWTHAVDLGKGLVDLRRGHCLDVWALGYRGQVFHVEADQEGMPLPESPQPTLPPDLNIGFHGLFLALDSTLWTSAAVGDRSKAVKEFIETGIAGLPEYTNYLLVKDAVEDRWEVRKRYSHGEFWVPYMFNPTEGFLLVTTTLGHRPTELHWTSDGARTSTLISELPR